MDVPANSSIQVHLTGTRGLRPQIYVNQSLPAEVTASPSTPTELPAVITLTRQGNGEGKAELLAVSGLTIARLPLTLTGSAAPQPADLTLLGTRYCWVAPWCHEKTPQALLLGEDGAPGRNVFAVGYLDAAGIAPVPVHLKDGTLTVPGATRAGSYSGKVEIPTGVGRETVNVTLKVKHEWPAPLATLALGLVVLFGIDRYRRVGRRRQELAIDMDRQRTHAEKIQAEANSRMHQSHELNAYQITDTAHGLALDRAIDQMLKEYDAASTDDKRTAFATDGEKVDEVQQLVAQFTRLLAEAEALAVNLEDSVPAVPPRHRDAFQRSPVVQRAREVASGGPLRERGDVDTAINQAALAAVSLSSLRAIVQKSSDLSSRAVTPGLRSSAGDLLTEALAPAEPDLKELRRRLDHLIVENEKAQPQREVAPQLPAPAALRPAPAGSRPRRASGFRSAVPIVVIVVTVVAVVVIAGSMLTGSPLYALPRSPPLGLDQVSSNFDNIVRALAGVVLLWVLAWSVRRLPGPVRRRLTHGLSIMAYLLAAAVAILGSGMAVLYFPNDTFGSPGDYLTTAVWGLGATGAVQVARDFWGP